MAASSAAAISVPQFVPEALAPEQERALKDAIRGRLAAENAALVAHYYTDRAVQELAEETGGCVADSLEMARFGQKHRVSVERVISGPGLATAYEFFSQRFPEKVVAAVDAAIGAAGEMKGNRIIRKQDFTIDHLLPRSRNGKNTWGNTACACFKSKLSSEVSFQGRASKVSK